MALRSISLPSRLDPPSLKVEEDLNKLKALQLQSLTSSSLQARLVALADLYVSFTDLIQIPSTQQALLSHNQGQLIQETLDVSVSLINTCSSSRDLVSSLKGHVRDLHSALRRSSSVDSHVASYVGFRKKSKKEVATCIKELKQTDQMIKPNIEFDHADFYLAMVVRVFREVACASIATLRSLLSFVSVGSTKSSSARWSLISRRSKVDEIVGEVASVDLDVWSMQSRKEDLDREAVKRRLGVLDYGTQKLEAALDVVFRSLVQNRVSLLNTLTQYSLDTIKIDNCKSTDYKFCDY